jgi:hypothetical protein
VTAEAAKSEHGVSGVSFCAGVRRGCPFGGGDVPIHRYRGFDPSVGGGPGRHASCVGRAGHAAAPLTVGGIFELGNAIAGLRDVLGEQTYESLARKGAAMTNTAMVSYAYDQIDQARTELEQRRADS